MPADAAEVVVGLDVGTTGVKAIAISPDGRVVALAEHGYPLSTPRPGWAEQDPEDWWRAALAALAELGSHEIVGIGLSGQMHGLVALDAADRVVRPAILWNDQRTEVECAEIEARIGLDRLIGLTGNRALPGFTAPKLLWLRRHEPEAFARIASIMLPKDYVRWRLTGVRATDVADASGTLLLDVRRRAWSTEVVDALELDPDLLPPVLESADLAGVTSGREGVRAGIPVAAGAGDCAAAALGVGVGSVGVGSVGVGGVGVDSPAPLSIVLGTSGVVFAALPAFRADRAARVHAFCHAVPDAWHAMGVMLSAAGSLQWFHDRLAADVPFEQLVGEAESWGPGAEGLFFQPYLAGERTPHVDVHARAAFVGLGLRHDRGAMVRAVLEGVAFGLRDSLELLRGLGVEAGSARVSGGGARSAPWLRILASCLDLPLETTAAEEGSAFGAALLGGVAGGVFSDPDDAIARCVRVGAVTEPDAAQVAAYDDLYDRFRALYPALKPLEAR